MDERLDTTDPMILEMHDLWQCKRAGRRTPRREDFDPIEMPHLLANLFLYDVLHEDPLAFRFRLVGTAIVAALGRDPTGKRFEEIDSGARLERFLEETRSVALTFRHAHARSRDAGWIDRSVVKYERLLLPLNDTGSHAGMIMGLAVFNDLGRRF